MPLGHCCSLPGRELAISIPKNLTVGQATIQTLGEPSAIMNDKQWAALASAMPPLERMKDWALSYSTHKHGISLQTLYRRVVHGAPSVLVIRDFAGAPALAACRQRAAHALHHP